MKVIFLSKFSKDIDKIKLQAVKDDIIATITEVENATKATDIKNLKKLVGFKTAYRIRIGEYRIGIYIVKDTVEFARIAHRKDVYKIFP